MGQEVMALWRKGISSTRTTAFVVEFNSNEQFERQESTAQALFRNEECFCCRAQTAMPSQLNEGGHLVRRQRTVERCCHNFFRS